MGFKLILLLFAAVVSYSQAGPAPPISRAGIYYYRGRPAVFPLVGGRTLLFYYYHGYGHPTTTFNGSQVRCSTFRHIIDYRRLVIGWGKRCILNGRYGTFKFAANNHVYGHTTLWANVRNGHGYVFSG